MRTTRRQKASQSESSLLRENDMLLARTSDEHRQFFKFGRAGAPSVERRVVYQVQGRVPVISSSQSSSPPSSSPTSVTKPSASFSGSSAAAGSSSSKHHHHQVGASSAVDSASSSSYRVCSVDVLSRPTPPVIPDAIALISHIRNFDHNNTSNSGSSAAATHDFQSAVSHLHQRGGGGGGGGTKASSSSSNNAAVVAASAAAPDLSGTGIISPPELISGAQTQGSFVFSRRNSARLFDVVGNVGQRLGVDAGSTSASSSATFGVAVNSSGGGGSSSGSSSRRQSSAAGSHQQGGGGANNASVVSPPAVPQPPQATSKVVPVCLTMPLRTYTARVAKAVHDIALLLALLKDCDG